MRGKTFGAICENYYKWKITVYDVQNDTSFTDKYFSIKHFNEANGTNYNSDHLQKIKKLGDYTLEDVKKAKASSCLGKYGHLNFEKIREKICYERRIVKTIVEEKLI